SAVDLPDLYRRQRAACRARRLGGRTARGHLRGDEPRGRSDAPPGGAADVEGVVWLRHLRDVESLRIDAVRRDRRGGSRVATTQVEGASVLVDLIEVGSTLTRAHATVLHPAHHRALLYDLHGPASLLPRIAAAVLAGCTGRAVLHPVTPAPFPYHP